MAHQAGRGATSSCPAIVADDDADPVPAALDRELLARQRLLERVALPIPPALQQVARRTEFLPESHRARVFSSRNPFSFGTVLVDGRVVATWSSRDGRTVIDLLEGVSSADLRSIEAEREALYAFCA